MVKEFRNGLVLGKFMPPQMGHLYLINSAAEKCERTYVMICSTDKQPIKGELRYEWLREIYKDRPNVRIIWHHDDSPDYPHECNSVDEFYNDHWVPNVYSHVKQLDVVFTSEEYGDEFARYLGIKHVQVDQPRSHYAVSGTAVREEPYKNWRYIPNVVKPYFTKKVVILGPESTGKSTLIKKLAHHYCTDFVEEYGRIYTERTGTTNLQLADFVNICKGHQQAIKEKLQNGNKVIFVDTEAIITKTFAEMYLDKWVFKGDLDKFIEKQEFDLYLLMDIDVPWVDDGTRDFPHEREKHFNLIKAELESRGIPYILISGNYDERFKKAIKEVNKLGYLY